MLSNLPSRILQRLRHWAHWRCKEPVIIFESDDWGLQRRASPDLLQPFGKPTEWAYEQTEAENDLEKLYKILEQHKDENQRPACFTANFITANPDFEKIAQAGFTQYYDISINDQDKKLKAKWIEGLNRKIFFPQYHGRSHLWAPAWLQDLQDNIPGTRELFTQQHPGGISLTKGQEWRYHSEYICWKTGEKLANQQLTDWISVGLDFFKQCFGFSPASTIAPHYIFTNTTSKVWQNKKIKIIQGASYRIIRGANGEKRATSHVLGERLPGGLLSLIRNIKFEPRPQRPQNGYKNTIVSIKELLPEKIPIIIDTHRINYVGGGMGKSFEELESLLLALKPYNPRFLTTTELGEAIQNDGGYHDAWTGEARSLTPLDTPFQKMLRGYFQIMEGYYANIGASKIH